MKVDVLGIKIDRGPKSQLLEEIRLRLDTGKSTFIVTPYSESIVAAQKDEEFRKILNFADMALPDGAGVVWAASFLKNIKLERIPGREFFWDLCRLAESRGESVFLLGGFGDTPAIVAKKLKAKFPNLKIAGIDNGTPSLNPSQKRRETNKDNISLPVGEGRRGEDIIKVINDSQADFLFVALGPIRQEKWIYHNLPKLHVKLAIGLGGTFDYIAGKKPLPPQFLSSRGLEWLWRLATQPWRIGRIIKGVLGLIWYTVRARISR